MHEAIQGQGRGLKVSWVDGLGSKADHFIIVLAILLVLLLQAIMTFVTSAITTIIVFSM